jgi:hypothetical protein
MEARKLERDFRWHGSSVLSMSRLFEGVGIKLYDGVPGTGSRVL